MSFTSPYQAFRSTGGEFAGDLAQGAMDARARERAADATRLGQMHRDALGTALGTTQAGMENFQRLYGIKTQEDIAKQQLKLQEDQLAFQREAFKKAQEQEESGLFGSIGSALGGAVGSVIPGFGTAAGAGIGGALGSLFG